MTTKLEAQLARNGLAPDHVAPNAKHAHEYVADAMTQIISRALLYYATHPTPTQDQKEQMVDLADSLAARSLFLIETTQAPPQPVKWRAGWLIPGANPEMGYQVLDTWSDAIEYLLDTMTSAAEGKGAGSDVAVQAVRRRSIYTNIKENEEGWVSFLGRAWYVEKLDDPNN